MVKPERDMPNIIVLHVVAAFQVFIDITLSGASERLNCIKLAFFHFGCVTSFDNWDTLSSMNMVRSNRMSIQISDGFHWRERFRKRETQKKKKEGLQFTRVGFSIEFNFIGFHHFLNGFSNITKSDINTGCLLTRKEVRSNKKNRVTSFFSNSP